ncbi:signal transduction histidine kinase [Novosphingobium chloroacetimidivorans]|uniref:histidine kinase n=1 Tax=Novosphingobium chloroacetimidivorans TaxID=1428314 RepID=A0A7W7KDA2_9SPHN|nr:MASE1 domain-containing protein [Novosphingobium chloroacetimidivorans]MBB4860370.1 signal transduction histidine kinase [Novosphingobium chloroacetimidivorans]
MKQGHFTIKPSAHKLARRAFSANNAGLILLYAVGFAVANWAARPWAGAGFFSLWYPPAGLRFAVLWSRGARLTPWLVLIEIIADIVVGTISLTHGSALQEITGAARPGLSYGTAMGLVRHLSRGRSGTLGLPPMIFGMVAIAAPALNAILVIPFEAWLPAESDRYRSGVDAAISLTGLAVGDLLGILVLAPPLLWLSTIARLKHPLPWRWPSLRPVLEDGLVMSGCLGLTIALWRAGLGAQTTPSLLAGAWIGLRHGRTAAWFAILSQTLVFLPYSAGALDDPLRLELHLGIASSVLVTWLAGSFSDAQQKAQAALDRRNRMLYQAQRLKTLRAMSVAVIHEISQPLSTLAIEAAHLRSATLGLGHDIAESAALVNRKAVALSDMVRRLRRFGGREVDEPSALPVAMLIQSACQIVSFEVRDQSKNLHCGPISPDLVVHAQEIELTQALVNLLRNALAAGQGQVVSLLACAHGEAVRIIVNNPTSLVTATREGTGMGIGLAIARTIVEAHGGQLLREDKSNSVRFVISLPLFKGPARLEGGAR